MTIKALYPTVRPTLNLDFAKTKALDPRVTFTRASTATFVGADGLIQTAASGAPRFDHNPATGESLGLLVEEARTNLLPYSEQFDNGAWTKSNATVTANAIAAPDGTTTADNLIANATNSSHYIFEPLAVSSGATTCSIYAKSAGLSWVTINVYDGGAYRKFSFNVSTGEKGIVASGLSSSIDPCANGWYRISCTYVSTGAQNTILFMLYDGESTENFLGDGTSGIYIWGAQLEAGSFPTSYIPTTSSTVTRAADVATVSNTGSSIFPVSAFTTVNSPYGTAGGGSTVKLVGPTVKRTAVYNGDLPQAQINALASVNDEFWRWRVLGSSFALPLFTTDGQVTVDWGDGTIETLTTAEHTFSNGGGYHDIGFRLNSGTNFRPRISSNASHATKVVALGPAPESMKLDGYTAFSGCSNLEAFDATVDATGGNSCYSAWPGCSSLTSFPLINTADVFDFSVAWSSCSGLTSFPLINTAAGTNFSAAWQSCTSLTSFPLIDTAAGTSFSNAWQSCTSLTSFPLIDTAAGTNFSVAWLGCTSLTSFPLLNTAAGTNFSYAWNNCNSLTSFPLIDTAAGTNFNFAWQNCSSLTSFPLIDTAAGTGFWDAWNNCNSLTSFPLIDTSSGTTLRGAWRSCSSLTSFPLIDTSSSTSFREAWYNCSSLTSFPVIDTSSGTEFNYAWQGCNSLTSFPLINTAAGTSFNNAWQNCSSLTSFPLIDTAAGTSFYTAWQNCSSLTSFPLINTAAGTTFYAAWQNCSSLTSFPLIDTAAGTSFYAAWYNCSSLTSFPLIDTAAGTSFYAAWYNCSSLTSFPLIDTAAGTSFREAWQNCSSLTDFPANFFDSWTGTPANNCFALAWDGCSALTATSVENILNSIDTSGQSAPASSVDITIDYNAGTGTPSVATAITNLQSRGWTITLNGVLQ
jgi:hypothetical protein